MGVFTAKLVCRPAVQVPWTGTAVWEKQYIQLCDTGVPAEGFPASQIMNVICETLIHWYSHHAK